MGFFGLVTLAYITSLHYTSLVVDSFKVVSVCTEKIITLVHRYDCPVPTCFDCVEFAAVCTETVQGIDGIGKVITAVAAVHPTFHVKPPFQEKQNC